jgi:serine/threonine protein kinase
VQSPVSQADVRLTPRLLQPPVAFVASALLLLVMDDYRVQGVIGDGSFGSVLQAVHLPSGDTVAIKRLKRRYAAIDDAMRLREVLALRELQHPCIVRLREAVYEEQQLSLVFEHLPLNLHQMLRQRTRPLALCSVRHIVSAAHGGAAQQPH